MIKEGSKKLYFLLFCYRQLIQPRFFCMRIFIDPRSKINYSSYYIQGMYDLYGKNNVHFSSEYFDELKNIDMLLAWVNVDENGVKRYIVDHRDLDDLIQNAYEWTDVYAKINISEDTLSADVAKKLMNIPPSFAIKIWNPVENLYYLIPNFFKASIFKNQNHSNIHIRPKRWVRNYFSLMKRQRIEEYDRKEISEGNDNYVFFASTFWNGEDKTNLNRKAYMKLCSTKKEIRFEGGFFLLEGESLPSNISEELLLRKRIKNKEYRKNINRSIFVFNTPAVSGCHGWKLGEFLSMGKTIISTAPVYMLPYPLEHKKHIYIVQNESELDLAIEELLKKPDLRYQLARNAKKYYSDYAAPKKVIEQIINR